MQKRTINIILIVVVALAVIITITAVVLSRNGKNGNGNGAGEGNGNNGDNGNGSGNGNGAGTGKKVYAKGRTISIFDDYPTKLSYFFGNIISEICVLEQNFEPAPMLENIITDPFGDGFDWYKIKINPSPCKGYSHGYVRSDNVEIR